MRAREREGPEAAGFEAAGFEAAGSEAAGFEAAEPHEPAKAGLRFRPIFGTPT